MFWLRNKKKNSVTLSYLGPVNDSKQYEPLIRLKEQSDVGPYSFQYKLL